MGGLHTRLPNDGTLKLCRGSSSGFSDQLKRSVSCGLSKSPTNGHWALREAHYPLALSMLSFSDLGGMALNPELLNPKP